MINLCIHKNKLETISFDITDTIDTNGHEMHRIWSQSLTKMRRLEKMKSKSFTEAKRALNTSNTGNNGKTCLA